ncbi:dienelactone hydrolase family protein [Lacipirellula sp.]|uniref:dienelactone hydrolase family protein n=1 Tax=Lacipirellula sp. TaxID=2691419 RepID=UPI003D103273
MLRVASTCGIWLLALVATVPMASAAGSSAVEQLAKFLAEPDGQRGAISKQPFADQPLSRAEAARARKLLITDWRRRLHAERSAELASGSITIGDHTMPIFYRTFGKKPASGRSLFISMHGGGGAPAEVNDQQWKNQQRLYEPAEGVYVAPRAPTDNWNLWHEPHIDRLFERLIEDMIIVEEVDPNRVYVMGYSAGGDGVYQLAPRMADRWAAAAMMAGHPNETSPLGLRNVPFTLHMGELDAAYDRNKIAAEWRDKLADLQKADPQGYRHHVEIHPGKGHWMDREDAVAVEWMAKFTRNAFPKRIVWKQDDVTRRQFYWLAVDEANEKAGAELRAEIDGQTIRLTSDDVPAATVLLNDKMLDLDQPVEIIAGERTAFTGKIPRTIVMLAKSLDERGDPTTLFSGETQVDLH